MTGAYVVKAARGWLGTPYLHQGRLKGIGVDCAGLIIAVARELGLLPPEFDVTGYSRQPDGQLLSHCDRHMRRVDEPQPGDVLITRFDIDPCHLGFAADYHIPGHLSMIHALCARSGRGKVIEQRIDASMRRRLVAVYRLPGVC